MMPADAREPRAERFARNEDHYREINDSIKDKLVHSPIVHSGVMPFVCECSRPDCTDAIELTLEEYRRVRSQPIWFAVKPGHELGEVEVVVEETLRYNVVEKVGVAGGVAAELA